MTVKMTYEVLLFDNYLCNPNATYEKIKTEKICNTIKNKKIYKSCVEGRK